MLLAHGSPPDATSADEEAPSSWVGGRWFDSSMVVDNSADKSCEKSGHELLALGRRLIGGESLRLFGGLIEEDYPLAALFVPLSGQ